jgi:hypothetical protein
MRRAREIGIRKVMGAVRGRLIVQFIGEAMLVTLMSMGLALLIVLVCLPVFNNFSGKLIGLPYRVPLFWAELVLLAAVTGVLSGSYPALYLSSFRPVLVLKGALGPIRTSALRKGLVVFQFVLSIVLITGALIVARQVSYIRNKDLGYQRDHLLYVPLNGSLPNHFAAFRASALALPGVSGMTAMTDDPTDLGNYSADLDWEGKDPNFVASITQAAVSYDFIGTMQLQLAEGRDFSRDMPTDSTAYIVNESAVAMMGLKHPVGQTISFWGQKGRIIGVLHDFHFQSLHDQIHPLLLRLAGPGEVGTALVRIRPGETRAVLDGLTRLCREMNPKFPFTYQFSDLEYARLYKSEEIIGGLSKVFALLAIVISCLGLLGLSMFTLEQRKKELGIRKVLGANSMRLYTVLSAEFLGLIGIAFLIAGPLAWYLMQRWLAGYAYRAPVGVGIFLLSGAAALLTALATVSYQSWKAANGNPVKALRSE